MGTIKTKIDKDNENGARRQLFEDLFYDFNRSRAQVYWMNFTRGIFFGFGTLLGGTILVALAVWILGQFVGFPYVGNYLKNIIDALQHVK
ncbi:MAG TPA: DUF5665 domain-containing protein [Candidatus Saccharimonadales bacterium]|nr:DUF5665 domain-containing protein [Candidatus Saccharimonadales bacterium]